MLHINSLASCETSDRSDGQAYAHDQVLKSKQKFLLVRICFTAVLIASIVIIWVSLFSPIIIVYLSRPSLDNFTRPYYDMLNHSRLVCNESNPSLGLNQSRPSCPAQYVFKCPLCLPICGVWHPFGDGYFKAYRIIAIIVSVIDFTFSTIGIIIFVRVPGSLKFPKIIYFFIFLSLIYLSTAFVIISIMGPHRFFCALRNEDFETVAANPSLLVTAFGAIVHYSLISFDFCFLVAAFNIFIFIFFPHWQILNSIKKKRALMVGEFIFCVCIPLLFPLAQLAIKQKYSFTRLALLPFPLGEGLTPLVLVLGPLWLLTGVALTLIALSIYRVQIMKYLIFKTIVMFKSYEIRHILFAVQVGFTVSFVFVAQTVQFANKAVTDYLLEEFWACITLKNNPQFLTNQDLTAVHCPASYKSYYYPVLMMLGYLTTGISAVEIVVILTTKDTYVAWGRPFIYICKKISVRTSSIGMTPFTS